MIGPVEQPEILEHAMKFVDKAKGEGKPFFCWLNPTRMHVVTHLSEKYEKTRTPQNGWSIHEAGMAQLDDMVGSVMKKLADLGIEDDTIVVFTTDMYVLYELPPAVWTV